jgi:pyridoxal phosphate enzyme (YggS family)
VIADRLAEVRQRMADAAGRAGRTEEIGLVAVSKTFPPSAIREAHAAGQRDFAENYGQELRDKARELADLEIRWHYIGRLQRNKAKYVAPVAFRVHAVESVEEARWLVEKKPVAGLVAVNVADETSKGGVPLSLALDLCERLQELPGFALHGLMCLPPLSDRPEDSTGWFEALRGLAAEGRARGLPLHELSMGTSTDFEEAIACGATWVRVGSAIFGTRE